MILLPILYGLLVAIANALPASTDESSFDLTVIHINDIHAHLEQTNVYTTRCRPENEEAEECYGGVARVYQKQKEIREEDPDALFLNAGDFYQGSMWYTEFKYKPMIELGNILNYTAMGVGNHDFDDSISGFAPFAEATSFDMLAANIVNNVDDGSFTEGTHYNKSTIKMVRGKEVGIIGYITRTTSYNFPDGKLSFTDEIEAVREEAKKLKDQNVDIIIALGHSGYGIDLEMAANISELDLVVGGHSHTFLYTDNGDGLPSIEKPSGDYPTYVENAETGKIIPVVQAYCYTKYLGHLKLSFDERGELLLPVNGNGVKFAEPILLDNAVDQNQQVLDMMVKWQNNLTDYKTIVGENKILLVERGRSEESNIGDVICQSMADVYDDTMISFTNFDGIRASLEVGHITYEDVVYVLPFDNSVDKVTMTGKGLKASIENAAFNIDPSDVNNYLGFGHQISGLNVTIVVTSENAGNRVTDLKVLDIDGSFSDVIEDKMYNIALPSFLAGNVGKFDASVFEDNIVDHTVGKVMIYEALRTYIEKNTPLSQEVDGRLTIKLPDSGSTAAKFGFSCSLASIFSIIVITFILQ